MHALSQRATSCSIHHCFRLLQCYSRRELWRYDSSFVSVHGVFSTVYRKTALTCSINGRCGTTGDIRHLHEIVAGSYLSMLPCEMVILLATLAHSVCAKRLHLLDGASATLPILTRLYRDGTACFRLAVSLRMCGAIVWLEAPAILKPSADYGIYALTSILSSRFFLRLRGSISRANAALPGSLSMPTADTFTLPKRSRHILPRLSRLKPHGKRLRETYADYPHE